MNRNILMLVTLVSLFTAGCSILPIKAKVKENHFRLENFKRDVDEQLEYVHLMCAHKKPTMWQQPKQYVAGIHDLWVKADVSHKLIPNSNREAYVNFKVALAADKSYMLNRKIENSKISIWIQEVDTGISVSEVLVAELKHPLIIDDFKRVRQCRSGSV